MKTLIKIIFFFVFFVSTLASQSNAATLKPMLLFTDLISGPVTGLDDGQGSGAIVTIWGTNLGSTQGKSTITIGGKTPYVYYWTNADGKSGGGPADIYSSHKIQEIAFSIPADTPISIVDIEVSVNGLKSNALKFTTRDTGNIYHIKPTGSDTFSGSFKSPWRTFGKTTYGTEAPVAGDIVYIHDGITENDVVFKYKTGSEGNRIAYAAYPGAKVVINATSGNAIGASSTEGARPSYIVLSKFKAVSDWGGVATIAYSRHVGLEITDFTSAQGQVGAIGGNHECKGAKYLGLYIHDYGGPSSDNKIHTMYFTNRSSEIIDSWEVGWGHFRNNPARSCLYFYDENVTGKINGTIKYHDNLVINQGGPCMAIITGGSGSTIMIDVEVQFYNNICINTGLDTNDTVLGSSPIVLKHTLNHAKVKFYNNVFYGWGDNTPQSPLIQVYNTGDYQTFGGSWEWLNNIAYDTLNRGFTASSIKLPLAATNNVWHIGDGTLPSPPKWDIPWDGQLKNPLFIDPENLIFTLEATSPSINAGTSAVSGVVSHDFYGRSRSGEYEIGVAETIPDLSIPIIKSVLVN